MSPLPSPCRIGPMGQGGVNATPMADVGGSGRSPRGIACTRAGGEPRRTLKLAEMSPALWRLASRMDPPSSAAAGPHLTINLTPRVAIDLSTELIGPTESSGKTALYQTQLELPIRQITPTENEPCRSPSEPRGPPGTGTLRRGATRDSTDRRSSTRDIERFRSARPRRSPSASRGKRWSVATSRPASPCRRISVPSEASPCAGRLACRSASEGIDDYSLPSA